MKLSHLFRLLMLSAVVVLLSCESDVEDIDFNTTSKLVVTAFISPQDTVLVVQLQKSQPAIGKKMSQEQLKVKNATVTVSNGNAVITFIYNSDTDQYLANVKARPLVAGNTYQLKVTTPAGYKAEATCTIPYTTGVEITELNTPHSIVQDYGGNSVRRYDVTFKWRDAPGVKNYYRTLAYKQYKVQNPYGQSDIYREPLYTNFYGLDLQNDAKADGGILISEVMTSHEYNYERMEKPFHIFAVLVVADKNYYTYHQSLYKQSESDGNPFAEPTIMYTNIEGGLGVFAGYNQVVAVKELR